MAEFLQSYGIWIFGGLLFVMLFARRGRGGCCGGGGGHGDSGDKKDSPDKPGPGCH